MSTIMSEELERFTIQNRLKNVDLLAKDGSILFAFKRSQTHYPVVISPSTISELNTDYTVDESGNVVVGPNTIDSTSFTYLRTKLMTVCGIEGVSTFSIADYASISELRFALGEVRPSILCLVNQPANEIDSSDWSTLIDDSSIYKLDDMCFSYNCLAVVPLNSSYLLSEAITTTIPIRSSRIVIAYGNPYYSNVGNIDLSVVMALQLSKYKTRSVCYRPVKAVGDHVAFSKHVLTNDQIVTLGSQGVNTLRWSRQQGDGHVKSLVTYPGYTLSTNEVLQKAQHSYLLQSIIRAVNSAIDNPLLYGIKYPGGTVIGNPPNVELIKKLALNVLNTYNLIEVEVVVTLQTMDLIDIWFKIRPYGELTGISFSVRIGND